MAFNLDSKKTMFVLNKKVSLEIVDWIILVVPNNPETNVI